MNLLIDTNVLMRTAQVGSLDHAAAKSAILTLVEANHALCVVPQVIYEFWVVATRSVDVNGLGMDVVSAERSIEEILEDFRLLKDERGIFNNWKTLVIDNEIKGKTAHDARLVAAMQRHRLTDVITFNKAHFVRYAGIRAHTPSEVLSGQVPS